MILPLLQSSIVAIIMCFRFHPFRVPIENRGFRKHSLEWRFLEWRFSVLVSAAKTEVFENAYVTAPLS